MGSLVSLLLLGAIYSIVYVVKTLRTTPEKDGGQLFGESFPTIEVLEPEQERESLFPVEPPVAEPAASPAATAATPKVRARHRGASVGRPSNSVQAMAQEKKDTGLESVPRHGAAVKLNSKSEAKRAFLYSEIFNRKY